MHTVHSFLTKLISLINEFSDVTDTMGGIQFCLKFSDGNVFVPAEEVAEKWMDKALDYLEEHLVIE